MKLIKVAKDLNVGLQRAADFLGTKGYKIEANPRTNLSGEMVSLLEKEFAASQQTKTAANKISLPQKPAQEARPAPGPSIRPTIRPSIRPTISVPGAAAPTTAPAPAPATQPGATAPRPSESAAQAPTRPAAPTTPAASPATSSPPPSSPAPSSPPPSNPPASSKPEREGMGLKVLGKIDLNQAGRPRPSAPKPSGTSGTPSGKTAPTPAPGAPARPAAPAPAAAPTARATPADAPPAAPATPSAPGATPPPAPGEPAATAPRSVQRAEAPELRGLKVLGKVDLKQFEKKPDSDDAKRKRTRKRVAVGAAGRPGATGRAGGGPGRPGTRRDEPREVTKKEIEDKIKATMARLSGKGKNRRQKLRRDSRDRHRDSRERAAASVDTSTIELTEFISVSEFASLLDVPVSEVILTCMNVGVIVSINQRLDKEVIELVASEFEREVAFINAETGIEEEEEEIVDDPASLKPRAPIVTVMGHVDHGKTSLLDYIRKAKVAAGEAGGITQHIGAYEVDVKHDGDDRKITFLDTPGHEAFTAMRARGAKVTDIAIIVIAADDSIMPQTREAISHAQAANVPFVIAINKVDKTGANPERIKEALSQMNVLVDDWGGKIQSQAISAKTGQGIDDLLEKVMLEADILELQANPDRPAIGAVLEASLEKGRGYVARTLVQTGTLRIGDAIVAGEASGKVKAMFNDRGQGVKTAGPSTPVLVLGLSGAPQAGERFKVMPNETEARNIASKRAQILREQTNRATKRISLDEIGRRLALGTFKELNLIVKGDVDGSVEALSDSLIKLSHETVAVNVIHKAVGPVAESDVLLASASDAIIIGFQVRPSPQARKLAEREGVQVKTYSIIYEVIDDIKDAIEGMLEPTKEERIVGTTLVRAIFKNSKIGTIAGCYVDDGRIARNDKLRVIRDGVVVYPLKEGVVGEISTLKQFKDDVKEVAAGRECGVTIKNFNDIREGDVIETYEIYEVAAKLER